MRNILSFQRHNQLIEKGRENHFQANRCYQKRQSFSQSFTAGQAYPEREFKKKMEIEWLSFQGLFIIIIIIIIIIISSSSSSFCFYFYGFGSIYIYYIIFGVKQSTQAHYSCFLFRIGDLGCNQLSLIGIG